jgi:hypothetical protein
MTGQCRLPWCAQGLHCSLLVLQVLQRPENLQLSLYLFRVQVPSRTIEVRLDRQDDVYGSPDIDDIERFSRALLQVRLGVVWTFDVCDMVLTGECTLQSDTAVPAIAGGGEESQGVLGRRVRVWICLCRHTASAGTPVVLMLLCLAITRQW